MNCQTCQSDLEDLLYGELDTAWRIALHQHLAGCDDCRAVQSALVRENEMFAQYYEQNALEPAPELWQSINARIKPEAVSAPLTWSAKRRNWFAPLLAPTLLRQAGFATLLVLLSVGLTALYFSTRKIENNNVVEVKATPTPSVTATLAAPEPQPTAVPNTKEGGKQQLAVIKAPKLLPKSSAPTKLSDDDLLSQQIAKATREYQSAIKLLERTIAKRKTQLDEGTSKQFEGSLALIDASIASSREALRAHPNDPGAARFLLSAYSRKVELMQEIAMR